MPTQILSLDGKWQLAGFEPGGVRRPLMLQGQVPGQVHVDLLREGVIPDPFWRDQAEQCQWVEHWDWRYEREFHVPDGFSSEWTILQFDGLDTFATIFLNGEELAKTNNMFVPFWFDVSGRLKPGRNTIEVVFTAPERALADKDHTKYAAAFTNDRIYARQMQCTYGWDWVHRFVSAGIWRSVRLVSHETARVDDLFVHTAALGKDGAEVAVELTFERAPNATVSARIDLIDPQGHTIATRLVDVTHPVHQTTFAVAEPQLWWPNGYGDHPLYGCHVALINHSSTVVDTREVSFGIRTVELEEIPDDWGSSFTLCVNGHRIFARGGNWVPADPWPSRISDAHYDKLIRLARDGNINMLRTWGGGIYEPEAFWHYCDQYGIMVMQDFLLACGEYPEEDPEFMENLRYEFAWAIRLLRNHPSLVLWSGNNELGMNSDPDTEFPGKRIAREVSGPLCAAMDPSRPYLPASPIGGNPNNAPNAGDCHISAWYRPSFIRSDMTDYRERISECWGRFVSEYAMPGSPPLRTLQKFMTAEDMLDPEGYIWDYHTKDNPYNGIDDMNHYEMLVKTAETILGQSDSMQAKIRHMEYIQCEWSRLAAESLRRRKYDCSGLLFWMYNDCWPASGWSQVDYYGFGKAAYYGSKRGFQPIIVAVEEEEDLVRLWVCNDTLGPIDAHLHVRFQPWAREVAWFWKRRFHVAANSVEAVAEVPQRDIGSQGVLVCDLDTESNSDRGIYYSGIPREMALPSTLLRVKHTNNRDSGTVTVKTHFYARVVTLDADLDFSDNYFDMLPGEERTIAWTCPEGSYMGEIQVSCWNGRAVLD